MSEYRSEPLELFLYAMKSDATKSRYKRRLGNFFDYLEIKGDLGEQAKQFVGFAQKNGNSIHTSSHSRANQKSKGIL